MTNVNVQLKLNIQAFWYWKLVKKSKLIKWHFQFSVQGFVLRHLAVLYMISTIKLTVNFNLLLCLFNYEWKINLTSGILIRPCVIDSINYTDLLEWWLNIKVCKVCLNGFASGQPQPFFWQAMRWGSSSPPSRDVKTHFHCIIEGTSRALSSVCIKW